MTKVNSDLLENIESHLLTELKGTLVEIINYEGDTITFNFYSYDSIWREGIVKVSYTTDLEVYLKLNASYEYQFDILWCDILPE